MFGRSLLLLALAGCVDDEAFAEQQQAIVGGTIDDGHPSVGSIHYDTDGDGVRDKSCTATMIGARSVLTAAHCVGYGMSIFRVYGTEIRILVVRQVAHPSYSSATPWAHDVAVATLEGPPDLPTMTMSRDAPYVGEPITMIGLGETSNGAGDPGTKRTAVNTIDSFDEFVFETTGATDGEGNGCNGDSGGPIVIGGGELIHGLMSYVPERDTIGCGPRMWSVRIDPYVDWILAEVAAGETRPDAAVPDASPPDAEPPDASPPDAGPPDAAPPDAGPADAAQPMDAMPDDAARPDARRDAMQDAFTDVPRMVTLEGGPDETPSDDGGCAIGGSRRGSAAWLAVAIAWLLVWRRKRSRALGSR